MITRVPYPLRALLTLALLALVFVLDVLMILLEAFANWTTPELRDGVSGKREAKP